MSPEQRDSIRVVVADDHPFMRQGIISLIAASSDIEVVGQATNGAEALSMVDTCVPDVLLLDLRMPDVDGYEVLQTLQEQRSVCRAIVLSMEDPRIAEPKVMGKGAWGYIDKSSDTHMLLDMIREVAQAPIREAASNSMTASLGAKPASLSRRQLEVLELLVKGKTNSEIAQDLWISERTVKHHVTGIFSFFGVQRRSQAVAKATGRYNAAAEGEAGS